MKNFWVSAVLCAIPMTVLGQDASVSELRADVHSALKSGHVPLSYGQTDEAMRDLYVDRANPNKIFLFYSGRSQDAGLWVTVNARNGWNREHLWPQSRGARHLPMKSDLHALRPADASINSSRGNLNFDNGGNAQREAPNTFIDLDSFEPRDAIKGDVARASFYMDLRYEGTDGEPDLELVDSTPREGGLKMGDLCTLFEWHLSDPVDALELALNDAIEDIQGNRNLFIDTPELAVQIFGPSCDATVQINASASTSNSEVLVIAAWNIANLGSPGTDLRGYDRGQDDYERIEEIISDFDADVIAFQEVGSIRALEAVLPDGYSFKFESRCYENTTNCATDVGDIYNAIAIREGLEHFFFQIDNLAVIHMDECGNPPRPVRGGVGVDVTFDGRRYLVPSIHLKATCKDNSVEPGTVDDCATQAEQVRRLRGWMDDQDSDATIILAGDFNRKLLDEGDKIRTEFFSQVPQSHFLPSEQNRTCWASFDFNFSELSESARTNNPQFDAEEKTPWIFTPRSSTEIDFFVIENLVDGAKLSSDQIELPNDYVFRDPGPALTQCDGSLRAFNDGKVLTFAEAYPSDHCPIILKIGE